MQNVQKPAEVAGKPTDEALRRSVEKAVPKAEQLPTGTDENPISLGEPPPDLAGFAVKRPRRGRYCHASAISCR